VSPELYAVLDVLVGILEEVIWEGARLKETDGEFQAPFVI